MIKYFNFLFFFNLCALATVGQSINWKSQKFELKNITGSIVQLNGEEVFKIERDLKALPFDVKNLEKTVDEPTYAKLTGLDFENGVIEVKMLSRIQDPSPFQAAQGFIGVAYRIGENDEAFECIYLRPRVGRSDNQMYRNHAVQYFAYPDHKFETLRKEAEILRRQGNLSFHIFWQKLENRFETQQECCSRREWQNIKFEFQRKNSFARLDEISH